MRLTLFVGAVVLLSACSSAPAPNSMTVDRNGEMFSGTAGAGWTNEDLQSNAFKALCPKEQKVTELRISRDGNGVGKFTGRCV